MSSSHSSPLGFLSSRGYVYRGGALRPSDITNEKITNTVFGLYIWEWMTSLHFEWDFLTGKRRFTWPMAVYFACRYLMLVYIFFYVTIVNVRSPSVPLNCTPLIIVYRLAGDLAVGLASGSLAIRTIAIWNRNIFVIIVLSVFMAAHVVLSVLDTVEYVGKSLFNDGIKFPDAIVGCLSSSDNNYLLQLFALALAFDFTVLALTLYKTLGSTTASVRQRMVTWRNRHRAFVNIQLLLVQQGILFFFLALCINVIQIILLLYRGVPGVNRLFTPLAYVVYVIISCRAVRSLSFSLSDTTFSRSHITASSLRFTPHSLT
ncbi:hypothetical protein CPB83DRAFT_910356 [Crepidotus variabilis]|uniref:Uncharacterized protein n=1 Tax=Crepidotus variabilis TaxID=179855 RepID=A0A9P6JK30_9AGAR|nr:hypothetical protein CPB83DRAFT_910356 [Crepidotus variabilis]